MLCMTMRRNTNCLATASYSLVLILSTLLSLLTLQGVTVTAQNWSGCVNRLQEAGSQDSNSDVTIGDLTRVCLQVGNGTDWSAGVSYVRASFEPEADTYSRLHIPNSYKDLISNNAGSIFEGTNITVGSASQSALSFLRLYYDATKLRVYPFLTAVLDVDHGVVRGITWDDACVFCGGFAKECEENTYNFNGVAQNQSTSGQSTKSCFVTTEECDALLVNDANSTACDLTLYVVWSGTDGGGKALQSQAYRFSEFPAQELSDRLTQIIPTFGLDGRLLTAEAEIVAAAAPLHDL